MVSSGDEDRMPERHPMAFWAQEGMTDLIVFVERNDDGGRAWLRMCFAEREEDILGVFGTDGARLEHRKARLREDERK